MEKIVKSYKASHKDSITAGMVRRVGNKEYEITKILSATQVQNENSYYTLFKVEMKEVMEQKPIIKNMSNTSLILNDIKVVCSIHGYCYLWKSHLKIAERLGYTLKSGYGFRVDTVDKLMGICKETERMIVTLLSYDHRNDAVDNDLIDDDGRYTHNDMKDVMEIFKAWEYLKKLGYDTHSKVLKNKTYSKYFLSV